MPFGLPRLAAHELQVAEIDDEARELADDEDRVFAVDRVDQQRHAPGQAELPEHGGHDAAPLRQIAVAAFSLPVGGVSDPIVTDTGAVIVKVLERQDAKPEELSKGGSSLREEMLNERRNRFYSAYMAKARERMKIQINSQVLAQIMA